MALTSRSPSGFHTMRSLIPTRNSSTPMWRTSMPPTVVSAPSSRTEHRIQGSVSVWPWYWMGAISVKEVTVPTSATSTSCSGPIATRLRAS